MNSLSPRWKLYSRNILGSYSHGNAETLVFPALPRSYKQDNLQTSRNPSYLDPVTTQNTFYIRTIKLINVISVRNPIQRSDKKLNLPFHKACYSQSQISRDVHENLCMQNAGHLVKIYSQKQLHVLGLQSGLKEKKIKIIWPFFSEQTISIKN